jgi:hypothetical protein
MGHQRAAGDDDLPAFSPFADFVSAVAARLEKGREAYGNRSFSRSPGELVDEIEEELLDVCAWSFILFSRLHELEQHLAERIATAYLLADQQQDHDQQGRADPQDYSTDDRSPRILRPEKTIGGTHGEHREGEHHSHGKHTGGEPDGLRVEVVQARNVWLARNAGAR